MCNGEKLYGIWHKLRNFDCESWRTTKNGTLLASYDKKLMLATAIALRGRSLDVSMREIADDGYPVGFSKGESNEQKAIQ